MSKSVLILWAVLAWTLPALIAGALGWQGIWGSGSALVDYLIPIPVAGGALHVPSFVVCGLIVGLRPSFSPALAACARALLAGIAIAGVLLLLNLEGMLLARRVGASFSGSVWQANPLGLFLTCDALLALVLTAASSWRASWRAAPIMLGLLLLPLLLPLAMAWPRSASDEPFRIGTRLPGETRGDELIYVFTRLPIEASDIRARALAWADSPTQMVHPRFHIDTEDVAVRFTTDPVAAQRNDASRVALTLCLYEDGTPPVWYAGAADCFSDHASFSERWAEAAARPSSAPIEVHYYLAAKAVCASEPPPSGDAAPGTELTSTRVCRSLERTRAELRTKYPNVAALVDGP